MITKICIYCLGIYKLFVFGMVNITFRHFCVQLYPLTHTKQFQFIRPIHNVIRTIDYDQYCRVNVKNVNIFAQTYNDVT